jgi:hypothetical protein
MAQGVVHLPNKHKALNSTPVLPKTKPKQKNQPHRTMKKNKSPEMDLHK